MQSAYRQMPLPDSQTCISVTAVYDPTTKEAHLFTLFGQPFGAGHAVPNFYRLAEWAAQACTTAFRLMLDHFFDDFIMKSELSAAQWLCSVLRKPSSC